MRTNQRTWTILFAGLGLLALLLLAVSLNGLELLPGERFDLPEMAGELAASADASSASDVLLSIFRVVMVFAWVVLPIYVVYLFKSKDARKRLLRDLIIFLPIFLVLYMMSNNSQAREVSNGIFGNMGQFNIEEMESEGGVPLPEFTEPPPWVTTVTTLLLAGLITAIAVGIIFFVWRRNRRQSAEPLHMVEREAQEAIRAIEAGGDLREVIIRCYMQMIEALNEYRNIQRERDMTPREFEQYLENRGLPGAPVHDLTQLFEEVRYGSHKPGRQEERRAINSLTAIVTACQRTNST